MKVIQWDVDSVDWKKPSAADIKKKVLKGVKPGSILLFHNDLENTTEALPEILTNLKSQGYKFVSVNDLIMKDNYTIDSNGKQIKAEPAVKNSDDKIEAVIAQYSDQLKALGLTDEQIRAASEALKSGDLSTIPEELRPFAQEVMARANGGDTSEAGNTSGSTSAVSTSGTNSGSANSTTSAEK